MNKIDYLTVENLVQLLPISEWKIRDLAKSGLLPHYRIGRRYLFKPEEITQFISNNKKA